MRLFLKLKHWQLFILLMGLPTAYLLLPAMTMDNIFAGAYLVAFPAMMIVFILVFLGWFYSVGTNLVKKIPDTIEMNTGRFRLFVLIPMIYMLAISVLMCVAGFSGSFNPPPIYFFVFIFLHLFSMFCMFYCLNFIARSLKT